MGWWCPVKGIFIEKCIRCACPMQPRQSPRYISLSFVVLQYWRMKAIHELTDVCDTYQKMNILSEYHAFSNKNLPQERARMACKFRTLKLHTAKNLMLEWDGDAPWKVSLSNAASPRCIYFSLVVLQYWRMKAIYEFTSVPDTYKNWPNLLRHMGSSL